MKRIADEPAFVLHRYDWSESSLILEVLTRHHGRIAVVAKGAKKPSSNFRPVLLPLQPLHLAFGGDAASRTLQAALDDPAPFQATLRAAASMGELKLQLRALLHYHCGVSTLRTRQLMMDLQSL